LFCSSLKAVTVTKIKKELENLSQRDLVEVSLKLAKFKKENKELLTYLLFEAENEGGYIQVVKEEIDSQFLTINTDSYYYMKKTIRKILRITKKYIRYSKKLETEVALLFYFCKKLQEMKPSYKRDLALVNLFNRQLVSMEKSIAKMHVDLQYDYSRKIEELTLQ